MTTSIPCMEIMAYLRGKFRLRTSVTAVTLHIWDLYLNLDLVPLPPMNDLIQEYVRLLVRINSFGQINIAENELCKKGYKKSTDYKIFYT